MPKAPKLYTRISPRRRRAVSLETLWEGPDHLLMVESVRISETYTRYDYKDMKGVFIRPSSERAIINIVVLFVSIVTAIIIAALQGPWFAYAFFAAPYLAIFLWNTIAGPGCRTYLVTGVQTVRLHSLSRRKKAMKALARIQERVLAAQADLIPKPAEPPATP